MSAVDRPRRRRRVRALTVLAAVVALALAGCGGGGGDSTADDEPQRPDSQPVQGGTTLAALWPLTGLPAPEETPDHPVLVVKVDNTPSSEPQIGLSSADMVVEELVEGGITRLAALFFSTIPDTVGPVRSMRASDIGVVKPTHGILVGSGAAPPTYGRLNKAKVTYFGEGGPGYYRERSRHAPYNLFVRLGELADAVREKTVVPASYLPWGSAEDFAGGQAATSIDVTFSRSVTTRFKYNAKNGKYRNTNTHAAKNDQFKADSVLVLRVREGDAGYLDPAGNPVPETLFFGSGNLLLFHNGEVTRGTWSKQKRASQLELSTETGPLTVPAGHVWIELVPVQAKGGAVAFK